jgi:DNA-binding transcriptional ArsR family regulator
MLSLLTGAELSATEVARELGISQANASYHLRQLLAAGELTVVTERRIRGGVAKIYRHQPDARPRAGGGGPKRLFAQALADELVRRSSLRRGEGRSTSTDAELWVDPQVWEDTVVAATELSKRLHAAAVPPGTEGTVRTSTTMALFEMESDR